MRDPYHPDDVNLHEYIRGLVLTVAQVVEHLHVSAKSLEELYHGKAPVTTAMAVRLSKALDSMADIWTRLQTTYDLAHTRLKSEDIHIIPIGSTA